MRKDDIIEFNRNNVYSGKSLKGYGFTYFSKKDFKPGEVVMNGHGKFVKGQTKYRSVQIGERKFYLPSKWTGMYWNHSCDPNTFVQTRADGFPNLIAFKKIKKGEEIHFAYWMSELRWASHAAERLLRCKCGAGVCREKILSFSDLPLKDQRLFVKKNLVSNYLKVFYKKSATGKK